MTERVTLTVAVDCKTNNPTHEDKGKAEDIFRDAVGREVEDITVTVTSIEVGRWFKASVSGTIVESKQEELPLTVPKTVKPKTNGS